MFVRWPYEPCGFLPWPVQRGPEPGPHLHPQNKIIPPGTWDIVDKLLLEKIPIAGISRVTDISEPWLQNYINKKYKQTLKKIEIVKKKVD